MQFDTVDPARLGRVAVLMGGMSPEREVSLLSGRGVLEALLSKGVDAKGFDPAVEPIESLRGNFDRVFIALHGRFGEDGSVQGVLEYLQIPYTGPGVCASAVAMNKALTRTIWAAGGLPVAKGLALSAGGRPEEGAGKVLQALGGDVVVKPVSDGSSLGVTRLKGAGLSEISAALAKAQDFHEGVLVEERIFGRELTVAIVDGKALPIIEIKAPEGDYDYHNKYFGNAVVYDCPAALDKDTAARVARASEEAFAALGARGWGRVDVMLRDDGSFVLLELNTSPGMTPHSLVPMAARALGVDYAGLCMHLAAHAALDHVLQQAPKAPKAA